MGHWFPVATSATPITGLSPVYPLLASAALSRIAYLSLASAHSLSSSPLQLSLQLSAPHQLSPHRLSPHKPALSPALTSASALSASALSALLSLAALSRTSSLTATVAFSSLANALRDVSLQSAPIDAPYMSVVHVLRGCMACCLCVCYCIY